MLDPILTPAAFFHAFALIGLWSLACRRWRLEMKDRPFVVLLLLWATLVLTGHLAGIGKNLGDLSIYVPLSFLSVGLLWAVFHSAGRKVAAQPLLAPPSLAFAPIESEKTRRFLFWFLAITLGLFALISVVLGLSVYPDNADSMIYRLPRAFWYVSGGSFLHPFEALDKRLVFYPLDGVALYVPLVLYGLPGVFHSVPSLLSWGLVVYTGYRFARELGGDRLIALLTAWLVGMTPNILAQATSTNDEILAAAALVCGLYVFWRWLVTGKNFYFLLAGLSFGLSAGTKLHIVFLSPIIGLLFLLLIVAIVKKPARARLWLNAVGWRTGLGTLLLIAFAFAPFLFYNYASTGRFYFLDDFKGDVFNLSASLRGGAQNLLIYLSQMILSPIADLNFWPVANDRQAFNTALNQIFGPFIDSLLDKSPSFYHMTYRFVGITLPVSVRFVEFSLWAGFVWLLWPFQAALALKQKAFPLRGVFFILALTPPLWLLFWSFSTLYMEGTATYFTFYLICAAPAAVFAFGRIEGGLKNELRWVCVAWVFFSNLLIGHNLVMYSGFRALPDLFYARALPYDWLMTEKAIIDEIRAAQDIRIAFTHEKLTYFGYMHWNPRARYATPFPVDDPGVFPPYDRFLQILPVSSLHMYGAMPIKVPGKPRPGVTYLGAVRSIGREVIFAAGNGVEKRYPEESDYIILDAMMTPERDGTWSVLFSRNPPGLLAEDHLTFEYELKRGEERIFHRPPSPSPTFLLRMKTNPHADRLMLTTIVRSAWSGKELARATYPLGGGGAWLPEGPEY